MFLGYSRRGAGLCIKPDVKLRPGSLGNGAKMRGHVLNQFCYLHVLYSVTYMCCRVHTYVVKSNPIAQM